MKVLLVVLISVYVVLMTGVIVNDFTINEIKNIQSNTVVQIDRVVRLQSDPSLRIACEKAILDYEKRIVIIEGLVSFVGNASAGIWVVKKMEIADGKLIIYIPADNDYEIRIGPQFHLLPKISK
jgi:hypothetical protein